MNKLAKPPRSVALIMRDVLLALLPGTAVFVYFFGVGIIFNIACAAVAALLFEAGILKLRRRTILPVLRDHSALVTAVLLALCLPPLAPWWLTTVAILFAVIIAKHLYGGLGHNLFNPAMVGYVVVLIAFPVEMTHWLNPVSTETPSAGRILQAQLTERTQTRLTEFDSVSSATPLDKTKTALTQQRTLKEIQASGVFSGLAGAAWQSINAAFLLGGLWLLYRRVIHWPIPVGVLLGLGLIALVFHLYDSDRYLSPWVHCFSGGTMLAAFFIATDPVTACATRKGRLIYATAIGLVIYVIRTWGGYPDGIAFAVLLLNSAVPMVDYFTQPRPYGHGDK